MRSRPRRARPSLCSRRVQQLGPAQHAVRRVVGQRARAEGQRRRRYRHATVFAAASLTESFTALGKQFEAAHSGVTVKFSFAGSSAWSSS